jgi:hypothetical protein
LDGKASDDFLVIDNDSETGNKIMAVTGKLYLYGKSPSTKMTRLSSSAHVGDNFINVVSA